MLVKGYDIENLKKGPVKELIPLCRKAGAEGCVLLKNDDDVLPLAGSSVSVFGRIQYEHYKSGTGSGGLVNAAYKTNIIDALLDKKDIKINIELAEIYKKAIAENPFDAGTGWGTEPWSQKEIPISEEVIKDARKKSEKAVIVIGRSAGEDRDAVNDKGSYLLTDEEERLISNVTKYFSDTCVVLNVGNIIDMNWVEKYGVKSVLYVWYGGQEGGNSVADILCGDVVPSGKLTDTIARDISDYPAHKNFGNREESIYAEDIYVGYRYFETFAKDKVLYPFGFGLSYTKFSIGYGYSEKNGKITVTAKVKNIGKYSGKEVIEVYFSAPMGVLGRPSAELCGFAKTDETAPGETASVTVTFDVSQMATFDDSGATNNAGCYVMEAGTYRIYAGTSVRDKELVGEYRVEKTVVTERLSLAALPSKAFDRIKPVVTENGTEIGYEPVPTGEFALSKKHELPPEYQQTGDLGIKLKDVKSGKATMEQFVAQLSDKDLCCIVRGEGMSSPKVTPGTGCAFGAVTDSLLGFGIPIMCGTDGPSGIRMDSGALATSLPNGTLFACTWNKDLIKELFVYEGIELAAYNIDAILGPGMNIHRYPLNGRNFEYFAEDPYVSGVVASAMAEGLSESNVTAVIKHIACNNQEFGRHRNDSVVSERALREVYLKGFEICVKNRKVRSVMTAYNRINGVWAANNYALATAILRNEWHFDGFVMTDWWAKLNSENGDEASIENMKYFVESQNDVYMVCESAENRKDNLETALSSGEIKRCELQRNAMNILRFALTTNAMDRKAENAEKKDYSETVFKTQNSEKFEFSIDADGDYLLSIELKSSGSELSQAAASMKLDEMVMTATVKGGSEYRLNEREVHLKRGKHSFELISKGIISIGKFEVVR